MTFSARFVMVMGCRGLVFLMAVLKSLRLEPTNSWVPLTIICGV